VRAVCDACGARQPIDWKSGDHCVECGAVARREKRCHWCAKWTPDGKFCRECGSGLVADDQYGAARMLKQAGVDQFALPERLTQLDADHRDHLTRMYQSQAAVISRLVDDALFVESSLRQHGWANELDDELTEQLPMSAEALASWTPETTRGGAPIDTTSRLIALASGSPVELVRMLASVALVRAGTVTHGDQGDLAQRALHYGDDRLRDEAALALGGWRARHLPVAFARNNEVIDALLFGEDVAERDDIGMGPAALVQLDPDDQFGLSLARPDVDALRAALTDPQRRYPAIKALAQHGHAAHLTDVLEELDHDQLDSILRILRWRDDPVPQLHNVLWRLAETHGDSIRSTATDLLARDQRPDDALRIVNLDPIETSSIQTVLKMDLPAVELETVARRLVEISRFGSHQYGVDDLADTGKLSDAFVPQAWHLVSGDEQRTRDLLRFAERQLGARGDHDLTRFLYSVVFGSYTPETRTEAFWCLKRYFTSVKHAWAGPLTFAESSMIEWRGSVSTALDELRAALMNPAAIGDSSVHEWIGHLLRYETSEANITAIAEGHPEAFQRFTEGLTSALGNQAASHYLRSAIMEFCWLLAPTKAWHDWTLALLDGYSGELDFEAKNTAERIRTRSS
jgi:hypothetical protein